MNVANPGFHQDVVHAGVRELGDGRIFLDFLEVAEQVAAPRARLMLVPVVLDEFFKFRLWSIPAASLFGIALVSANFEITNGAELCRREGKSRVDGPTKPGLCMDYERLAHHLERTKLTVSGTAASNGYVGIPGVSYGSHATSCLVVGLLNPCPLEDRKELDLQYTRLSYCKY